ncbi:MAG: hypothetical protein OTJ98_06100 [Dehalococcoidia bacterium]|nr:hypothetical protein [Dehalococcoidia bacterium]
MPDRIRGVHLVYSPLARESPADESPDPARSAAGHAAPMVWRGRTGAGARTALDCCLAALALRAEASNLAREVRRVGTVLQIGTGT